MLPKGRIRTFSKCSSTPGKFCSNPVNSSYTSKTNSLGADENLKCLESGSSFFSFYSYAQNGNKDPGFLFCSVKVNAFMLKDLKQILLTAEIALCSNY